MSEFFDPGDLDLPDEIINRRKNVGKDFTQQDMSGALFKNKKKSDESHPDYTGSQTVKGQKFAIGAWIKKSKAGETYMSLSIRPWQEKQKPAQTGGGGGQEPDFPDDDVPLITNVGNR